MKKEIIKKEEELRLAMIISDVDKLEKLIDDSLMFCGPDGTIATKQLDLEAHKTKIQKISNLTPSEQVIKLYDNLATVTVKMQLTGTFGDFDISGIYRYLRVWKKFEDNWRIIAGSVIKIG